MRGTSASGTAKFGVNDLKASYERIFRVGSRLVLTPFAGFNAVLLKQTLTSNFQGDGTDATLNPYSITETNKSNFSGAGPRMGLNVTGMFTEHFGMVAQAAMSVIAGSMYSNTGFVSFGGDPNVPAGAGNTTPVNTKLADQRQAQVVPAFDSKVGFLYGWLLNSGSSLNFELGYAFSVYVNAFNQVVPTALVPGAFNGGTIAIETSAQVQSNLGLNGPYLKAHWDFAT